MFSIMRFSECRPVMSLLLNIIIVIMYTLLLLWTDIYSEKLFVVMETSILYVIWKIITFLFSLLKIIVGHRPVPLYYLIDFRLIATSSSYTWY